MIRTRKRHAASNGSSQARGTSVQTNIQGNDNNFQNSSNVIQETSNLNTTTNNTGFPVKRIRNFRNKNVIDDSSSHNSESEGSGESSHLLRNKGRRGTLRPLSDYETGESSDKSTMTSSNSGNSRRNIGNVSHTHLENSISNTDVSVSINIVAEKQQKRALAADITSDSSDSGIPIGCRKSVKRMKLTSSSENSVSDEEVVGTRNVRKKKRQVHHSSSSDLSDTDIPVGFRRSMKRMRLPSSNNSSTSEELSDAKESSQAISQAIGRINILDGKSQPKSTSLNQRESQPNQDTGASSSGSGNLRRRQPTRVRRGMPVFQNEYELSTTEDSSEDSLSPPLSSNRIKRFKSRLRPRRTNLTSTQISRVFQPNEEIGGSATESIRTVRRQPLRRGRRIPIIESEDESSVSDNEIRPIALSNVRPRVIQSDYTSSTTTSSDTDDSIPFSLVQRARRRSQRGILLSDDDNVPSGHSRRIEEVSVKLSIQTNSSPKKPTHGNSSDTSDGESEKCPICFSHFKLQQIGKPSSCDHKFCSLCIQQWAKNNVTCPIDRKSFNSISVYTHVDGKVLCELPVDKPVPNPPSPEAEGPWIPEIMQGLIQGGEWGEWVMINTPNTSDEDGPEEVCCVCFSTERSDFMITCDFCNNVYHMDCVDPPLQYIPVEEWFCPPCVEDEMLNDETTSDSE